ncbi:hypothetical protein EDC04DRAFT_2716285 [Pisolithus marmoratus]|nr:hypothetical protein EDC04DRAFT_2716285 [Pisolithus marmoratus]
MSIADAFSPRFDSSTSMWDPVKLRRPLAHPLSRYGTGVAMYSSMVSWMMSLACTFVPMVAACPVAMVSSVLVALWICPGILSCGVGHLVRASGGGPGTLRIVSPLVGRL